MSGIKFTAFDFNKVDSFKNTFWHICRYAGNISVAQTFEGKAISKIDSSKKIFISLVKVGKLAKEYRENDWAKFKETESSFWFVALCQLAYYLGERSYSVRLSSGYIFSKENKKGFVLSLGAQFLPNELKPEYVKYIQSLKK